MIEELQTLSAIVGDLSEFGIWIMILYMTIKLGVALIIGGTVCYCVTRFIGIFMCDVSKEDYNRIVSNNNELHDQLKRKQADFDIELQKKEAQIEKVKHLYIILKESMTRGQKDD